MRTIPAVLVALLSIAAAGHAQQEDPLRMQVALLLSRADAVYDGAFERIDVSSTPADPAAVYELQREVAALLGGAKGRPEATLLLERLSGNLTKLSGLPRRIPRLAPVNGRVDLGQGSGIAIDTVHQPSNRRPLLASRVMADVLHRLQGPIGKVYGAADQAHGAADQARVIANRTERLARLLPLYQEYLSIRATLETEAYRWVELPRPERPGASFGVSATGYRSNVVGLGGVLRERSSGILAGAQLVRELDSGTVGGELSVGVQVGDFIVMPGFLYLERPSEVLTTTTTSDPTGREPSLTTRTTQETEAGGATVSMLYARQKPFAFGVSFSTVQGFGVKLLYGF